MIYIENIYICLIAPLIIACFCAKPNQKRSFIFVLCGFTACLLSAYINTFFAYIYSTDLVTATTEIAPVIEELIKFMPILFYLIIFQPSYEKLSFGILTIALSFATFENICYLTEHGTKNLYHLLMRGFGTGAMHIICGTIVGYGILFRWGNPFFQAVGTFGVLCIAIVFHGQYNLLISGSDITKLIGCLLPISVIILGYIIKYIFFNKTKSADSI